jgi:hypothetical protein
MRILALCLVGVLVSAKAIADPLLPRDVVKAAIDAAQGDKLELFLSLIDVVAIQGQKEQPRSPQDIVQLLKGLDLKALKMDDPRGGHEQGARI